MKKSKKKFLNDLIDNTNSYSDKVAVLKYIVKNNSSTLSMAINKKLKERK